MRRIAVTGGIACGKTVLASYLRDKGFPVFEADEAVHDLLRPGQDVFKEVVNSFGEKYLTFEGALDRAKLGSHVFSDGAELERLERIIHPQVIACWHRWLKQAEQSAEQIAFVVIPLLFEISEDTGWDAIVCVCASKEKQVERLTQRGLNIDEGQSRIDAQWSLADKASKADYVICNNGSLRILRKQVDSILVNIQEK